MRILITGNMGYIGPTLMSVVKRDIPDARILGYDTGFFAHCLTAVEASPERFCDAQFFGDVRQITDDMLRNVDAVVHLAAISNDPMGNRFERVTSEINYEASARLAARSVAMGVKKFVFASSCSLYGYAESGARRESDELNPLTAYARSKASTEAALSSMDCGKTTVTALRFSTACGMTDRLRLDLVLNDFVACAVASKEITVLSDGTPWRPLIDVKDMARAIVWALTRDQSDAGQYLAVNVGSEEWNYQVRDLADAVAKAVPGTAVSVNTNAPPDKRSYRVDFSLFRSVAPYHQPQVTLDQSIAELKSGFERMGFDDANFRSSQFMRLKVLEQHLNANRVDEQLYWL
jgi:nucleoside-diphosphate-sugar epimerase